MAQFTIYKSTDTSAPVLTGQTGSLITLLDAVLVNGYGSKTAAGWTKAFSGTSKAAYRMGGANLFYWRVQDDGPGAGTFKEARIVGYEAMTGVDTGTFPFPTVAQAANGLFLRKSTTADATARAWMVVADDRTCYVFILTGDAANQYLGVAFGDFYSAGHQDGYRTMIIGNNTENSATASNFASITSSSQSAITGHYIARGYTGKAGAIAISKVGDYPGSGGQNYMTGIIAGAANALDGGFYLSPVWLMDPTTVPTTHVRGKLRGVWQGLHVPSAVSDTDTLAGASTDVLTGKSFAIIKSVMYGSSAGYVVIETSNTLLTN